MRAGTLFIFLLLSSCITYGASFGRKKTSSCCKCNEQPSSKADACDEEEEKIDEYYYDCDPTKFGIVQKIPYFRTCPTCDTLKIDFSSACVRCGMCLAIAEKINQTLLDVHEMMPPSTCLNDTEAELLLRTICDHSFRYYSLREYEGNKFICDDIPGFTLLSTSADGLWESKLKDLCHYYLDEINEARLYEQWQEWCNDDENSAELSDVICRNNMNLLRDCRNMKNPEKYGFPSNTYHAKVKITAAFYDKYEER